MRSVLEQEKDPSSFATVAEAVRDFYERNPYPRPVDSLDKYRIIWQDRNRRRAEYHLYWPDKPYREDQSILVAGCGTSQAAKYALRWPKAQITGIDFSATSVRCTETLKRKYHLDNLRVFQLPIERVQELGMSFDQIICTGVLHHLADPDAGLHALRGVLALDGAMQLMVYAPYGRIGVYLLQEFCKKVGIHATEEGFRDLISVLKALPPGHPLENLLREAPDLWQKAELVDALLHPHDRAYSVSQFFDLIKKGGLRFGRWVKQAPYSPHCGLLANIKLDDRMARLHLAEQYAAVELFRGTLVRHSAILYRSDEVVSDNVPSNNQSSDDLQPLSFTGEAWLNYVPIRAPDTIRVQENLPPGVAAVLVNQTHVCKDLLMLINKTELDWLDTIDGIHKIGKIVQDIAAAPQESKQFNQARDFFERLWWYDQVVFDTSHG